MGRSTAPQRRRARQAPQSYQNRPGETARPAGRGGGVGVRHTSGDCEIIVLMDADLSDDPLEMPMLIQPIVEEGYDLVLGSRMLGRREDRSMSAAQIFGSRLASLLIRWFYGVR